MKFEKLTLYAGDLHALQDFYQEVLGFNVGDRTPDRLEIIAGATNLVFQLHETHPVYHFAFLIPTGSLESAIEYVESRGIKLLPLNGDKIIHFDSGRSIYFYDPDGNIAEFIERPGLDYPPKNTFDIADVIRINEIGHPVTDPIGASHELIDNFGIVPIKKESFRDNFCWVGDHEGAIIVVAEGRHWLPTQVPAVLNDFKLRYTENDQTYRIRCESGITHAF